MTNVINIEQCEGQSLDIEVTSNDRGPRGLQGEKGENGDPGQDGIRGPRGPRGYSGENGRDGAIQYKAGVGIKIENETISVSSSTSVNWGGIGGNMSDQTDLITRFNNDEYDIDTIQGVIPAQATVDNKLADKSFVNSSIATNTATFRGTYNSVAELPTTGITNNDYAFVISVDEHGNTLYNRYKYNGTTWAFEYSLNNSSFTAAQWATINSGMVATDKTKLDNLATVAISGSYNDLSNKPSLGSLAVKNTVATADIDNSAVTTDKIADSAITPAKLGTALSSIITARGNAGWVSYSSGQNINFVLVVGSNGNLTLNNKCIVIGAGISRVKVSFNAYCGKETTASNYAYFTLYKNSEPVKSTSTSITGGYSTACLTPFIVNVQEGDILYVRNNETIYIDEGASHITVEAIA